MRSERGSVTIWILGLAVMILFMGGISVDLWRALSDRRQLSAMADAAAVAGASGIDVAAWRQDGTLKLDLDDAEERALSALAMQSAVNQLSAAEIVIAPDGQSITVALERPVEFTLLSVFASDQEPFLVRVVASARPASVP